MSEYRPVRITARWNNDLSGYRPVGISTCRNKDLDYRHVIINLIGYRATAGPKDSTITLIIYSLDQ